MCEGIAVSGREISRPESQRSPTILAHEASRSHRMADVFEGCAADPLMLRAPRMAHLILAVAVEMARKRGLGDLTNGRPQLASWMRPMSGRRRPHRKPKISVADGKRGGESRRESARSSSNGH